ncbi:MAG TPA: glycosyl transferase, partial [Thermoanaerobaculia bacterium]
MKPYGNITARRGGTLGRNRLEDPSPGKPARESGPTSAPAGRAPAGRRASGAAPLDPIRGELLSADRLIERAQELARTDRVAPGRQPGAPLLARLEENGRVLLESYRDIARAIAQAKSISPAAEWLADNFHIVDDQLREVRDDLPRGYYRELPKLAGGPLSGAPRVFGIAWAFVEHTDSRVDLDLLRRFVASYQTVEPLTIGELWALAISLRLVLVENLRRLSQLIVGRRAERESADALADSFTAGAGTEADREERFRLATEGRLPTAFLVQLVARLRDRDPETTPILRWIETLLAEEGTTRDEIVLVEHRAQVAAHLSVRNVITSMRLMSSVDWTEFFESVSLVEAALRDGTNVAEMDFPTRDRYRHAVEDLARGSGVAELEIARRAVAKASAPGEARGGLRADPGYHLISAGRAAFEKEVGYRAPVSQWLRRAWVAWANPGYPVTICLLTLAALAVPLAWSAHSGAGAAVLALLGLLALVPASEIALAVINQDVQEIVGPRRLPKLALESGIPEDLATIVVVPTLLMKEEEAREQVEQLEVRFLANPEDFVHFALLTDWADAPAETMEGDEELVTAARAAVSELNRRHGPAGDGGPRFLLFHRRRIWNAAEGCWMGWERKRGKLAEFNRLLRGAADTTFLPGEAAPRARVRYVITLDGDTRLPRGAIRKLVGAMAHPLNRPVFDDRTNRVVFGNGILQPRITAMLSPIGHGTLYERVFSGQRGTDPYAFAVSDVYQDLFGEGIYTGKGIYDVDAFERALQGRVPENTLLSHDLFEGIFTRAGLLSDVELFEEFPSHYEVAALRQHRWARGDWQLVPWLTPRVRNAEGKRVRNPIPLLGRWKILDNLRRSLLAPTAAAALVAAWTLPRENPAVWTAFVAAAFAFPRLLPILATAMPRRRRIAKRSVLTGVGTDLARALSHTTATLV